MSITDAIFNLIPIGGLDISDNTFNKERIHDWRDYVPDGFKEIWNELTTQERFIVAILCKQISDNADLY